MSLNLMTISTANWLESHCARWVRFVKKSNPDAKRYLVCISDDPNINEHPVVKQFDCVKVYTEKDNCRDFYNIVRMGATKIFDVPEIMYCDADADVLQDLSGIPAISDKRCLYCMSPTMSQEWIDYCHANKLELFMVNNGFLYMRGDMTFEYCECMDVVKAAGLSERMRGTYAFNLMVRKHAERCFALPERISSIWWNAEELMDCKIAQYCNSRGQAKRLALEMERRNAQ
jgi:hypothetical protein